MKRSDMTEYDLISELEAQATLRRALPYSVSTPREKLSFDDATARVLGTATQNAFDLVNVDTVHRKIRIFRYGAGQNCYGVGEDRFLPDGISY